eukprot:scaffold994_cov165-Ochromonas_danica.AAC.5
MIDEILKVRDSDLSFFRRLLDLLTGLQHRELQQEYPTFLLLTSLELVPVSRQIVTDSGRRLQPIPLPFLRDVDLDVISDILYTRFSSVLCAGRPELAASQLDRFNSLKLLIRVAVSISGRHFRCLEEALKSLYKRLVSVQQHESARKVNTLVSNAFIPLRSEQIDDIFQKKGGDVDVSIKEIFDTVVNQVELTSVTNDHYQRAMELFMKLVNEPGMYVNEKDLYDLEGMKIVFVKSRDLDRPAFIIPRVNLPFLYLYPRAERLSQYEVYRYGSKSQLSPRNASSLLASYWRLRDPHIIMQHTQVLLGNIGVALTQPFSSLARTFEEIMIFAEMLTVAARLLLPNKSSILLEDVIPDVIFKPWGDETLSVSPFVRENPIQIACDASSENQCEARLKSSRRPWVVPLTQPAMLYTTSKGT